MRVVCLLAVCIPITACTESAIEPDPTAHAPRAALLAAGPAPITPDANTVVLDRFDGATIGSASGPLGYAASQSGLGQAGLLGPGVYIRYPLSAMSGGQGTVEMWLRPDALTGWVGLLNFNWNDVTFYPSAGHVLHLGIAASSGNIAGISFWPSGHANHSTAITAGDWNHLATSWGPAGTKIYINGTPVAGVAGGPAISSNTIAYLNYWANFQGGTTPFSGLVDEFHISNIQRTDDEVAQHARKAPTVLEISIDVKPNTTDNTVNPTANGVLPVAILTSSAFSALDVDVATVRFGVNNGAAAVHRAIEDVDSDGDADLLLHFRVQQTGILCPTTRVELTAATSSGQPLYGSDAIRTTGCK